MKAHRKEILMLVDDDNDDRDFFLQAVSSLGEGFGYRAAENGMDALRQLRQTDSLPDYIFLDLNMPYMNGKDCLAELKKDELLKNIPVIIYSTSISDKDIDSTRALGAAHYLSKPSNVSSLPGKILAAIEIAEHSVVS